MSAPEEAIACNSCDKTFRSIRGLNNHQRVHDNDCIADELQLPDLQLPPGTFPVATPDQDDYSGPDFSPPGTPRMDADQNAAPPPAEPTVGEVPPAENEPDQFVPDKVPVSIDGFAHGSLLLECWHSPADLFVAALVSECGLTQVQSDLLIGLFNSEQCEVTFLR